MNTPQKTIVGPYTLMPEDEQERKQFDYMSRVLDRNPLKNIANSLILWSQCAPQMGSYAQVLAIFANEVMKTDVELQRLRQLTANGITWIQGKPRLEDEEIRAFVVKIGNGQTRELFWLENAMLDSQGDEQPFTGWHTRRKAHGYAHFYEPYKGKVTHYLANSGRRA